MFIKRITPYLDVNNGRVVKDVNFVNLRDAGNPVEIVTAYDKAGAGELVFLGTTASPNSRRTVVDMMHKVAEAVLISFTVGGGIRTVGDLRILLRGGADKVSIDPSIIDDPCPISDLADKFGRQCVVAAMGTRHRADGKGWNTYKHGGHVDVGIDALEWAIEADRLGAGKMLLTSMDCDGTKDRHDDELISPITSHVSVPVIASGGAGNKEHFYDALTKSGADTVLTASLFHYKELEVKDLKEYLSEGGTAVRIQWEGQNAGAGGPDDGSRTGDMVNRVKHVPVFHGWKHMGRSG